jgi:hypothetical protein
MFMSACSTGFLKALSDLNAIRQHLIQKYHDEVGVNLTNSRFLNIVFVNSSLNKLEDGARAQRAQEAALFVSRNYEGIKSIQAIWISFVATETHLIFFHRTDLLSAFGFDKDGRRIGSGSGSAAEEDPRAPVAKFSDSRNETDVSVTRIQLQGNMDEGVALVPHFTVTGDTRRGPVPAPEFVILDFASYSRQQVFTGNAELEIACDERPTVKGFAQLLPSSASGSDETIAQFLTVRVSFKSFLKMSSAQHVTIRLGSKRFQLKPDDINALAGMAARVVPANGVEGG